MANSDLTSAQVIRSNRNKKRNAAYPPRDPTPNIELGDFNGGRVYTPLPVNGLTLDGSATLRQVDPKDYLGYFSTRYSLLQSYVLQFFD